MLLHSDTLFWFRASFIVFSLTRQGDQPIIYRLHWSGFGDYHNNNKMTVYKLAIRVFYPKRLLNQSSR
jgi:hypothetical protein